MSRLSIDQYAICLAHVASLRSEDPRRKVGAVALDHHNRVIATGYNGLVPGFDLSAAEWEDEGVRLANVLHAEQNLVSLFRRGEVNLVAVTAAPCSSCARLLLAYGIRRLVFSDPYERDPTGLQYLLDHGVYVVHAPRESLTFVFEAALSGVSPKQGPKEDCPHGYPRTMCPYGQCAAERKTEDPLVGACCDHGWMSGACTVVGCPASLPE